MQKHAQVGLSTAQPNTNGIRALGLLRQPNLLGSLESAALALRQVLTTTLARMLD